VDAPHMVDETLTECRDCARPKIDEDPEAELGRELERTQGVLLLSTPDEAVRAHHQGIAIGDVLATQLRRVEMPTGARRPYHRALGVGRDQQGDAARLVLPVD